ncbi:MAG: dephospho-CoA kinase [Flavobacteriales bacterium]
MITVGLTGGIGSGKSTVAKVFELLGVPVFYADTVAKEIYQDSDIKELLVNKIGSDIYNSGVLNKSLMRQFLFESESNRVFINQLIHPRVAERYHKWKQSQNAPYIIREAAILIESGSYKDCDHIIVITAPADMRVKRVVERDKLSVGEVLKRIEAQMSDAERSKFAQHLWINDNREELLMQILLFDNAIRA